MRLFRISSSPDRLWSSIGAGLEGGRWNDIGEEVLYTAKGALSIALTERLVHIENAVMPPTYWWGYADAPDTISEESVPLSVVEANGFDGGWSRSVGSQWFRQVRTCLLTVPSRPSGGVDLNVVINPNHSDFATIIFSEPMEGRWDSRLFL